MHSAPISIQQSKSGQRVAGDMTLDALLSPEEFKKLQLEVERLGEGRPSFSSGQAFVGRATSADSMMYKVHHVWSSCLLHLLPTLSPRGRCP